MDLSCNETMINDAENEYNIYVEYQSDGKSSATSAGSDQSLQQPLQSTKLYSNACEDPTFLKDRCLKNLLTSQKRYTTPSCGYFNTVQKTLTPQMRKIVAEWVIEVSAHKFSFNGVICVVELNERKKRILRKGGSHVKKLIAQSHKTLSRRRRRRPARVQQFVNCTTGAGRRKIEFHVRS
jgi:hypothetical protein